MLVAEQTLFVLERKISVPEQNLFVPEQFFSVPERQVKHIPRPSLKTNDRKPFRNGTVPFQLQKASPKLFRNGTETVPERTKTVPQRDLPFRELGGRGGSKGLGTRIGSQPRGRGGHTRPTIPPNAQSGLGRRTMHFGMFFFLRVELQYLQHFCQVPPRFGCFLGIGAAFCLLPVAVEVDASAGASAAALVAKTVIVGASPARAAAAAAAGAAALSDATPFSTTTSISSSSSVAPPAAAAAAAAAPGWRLADEPGP